jgi:hypothetical protein
MDLWIARVWRLLAPPFGVALGVTLGGALIGGLAVFAAGRPDPDYVSLAWRIRIWAVAVAIGGAMTALEKLEHEFLASGMRGVLRDVAVVAVAYAGAQAGYALLRWLVGA